MPFAVIVFSRGLGLIAVMGCVALAGCGDSSAVHDAGAGGSPPALTAAQCLAATAAAQTADAELVPDTVQIQNWVHQIEQFGGGFRPTGSAAELGYIDQLASQLAAMGASQVRKEPYTFPQWTAGAPVLTVSQGGTEMAVPVAGYIPYSGNTGTDGVQGRMVYLPGLSAVDITGALLNVEQSPKPVDVLGQLLAQLTDLIGGLVAGAVPLADYLLTHDLKGKVVIYDVPRLTVPAGVFEALSLYTNNSGGTMGPLTPYSRPYIDMMFVNGVNSALKKAGAIAVIGIIDYPAEAADGSYYPFFGLSSNETIPGVYVDSQTGVALEQQAAAASVQARLTLAAEQSTGTSYNISAVIPGLCPQEILIGSHVDGTNALEDDGPAAILAIARYFLQVPQAQRLRTLRIVLTSGHFVGSAGIQSYIQAHRVDLTANVLAAIELEHLGAREWAETSPGAMDFDGLTEPLLLMVKSGTPLATEAVRFAHGFDRSLVMPPVLPVGEGQFWGSDAGLPTLSFITGPVYLTNDNMPQLSEEFIDYTLMQRQITSFIQMMQDLNMQTAEELRPDLASRR